METAYSAEVFVVVPLAVQAAGNFAAEDSAAKDFVV